MNRTIINIIHTMQIGAAITLTISIMFSVMPSWARTGTLCNHCTVNDMSVTEVHYSVNFLYFSHIIIKATIENIIIIEKMLHLFNFLATRRVLKSITTVNTQCMPAEIFSNCGVHIYKLVSLQSNTYMAHSPTHELSFKI